MPELRLPKLADDLRQPLKILYVCQYFPPEMSAPAARADELGSYWAASGQDVTILTGFPNHPSGKLHPEYRKRFRRLTITECISGMKVIRTWLWPLPNRRAWERMLNYSSFAFSAALRGLFAPKMDVVIGTSPQLLVPLAALFIARMKRARFIFEVRDLWPESLAAVGASSSNSALFRILGWIAGLLYRRADHIVVVTPAFKDNLIEQWKVPEEKISTIMNGVDLGFFMADVPLPADTSERRFQVSWIGTMGNAHGLELIIEVASRLLHSHPDITFLLAGDGAEREKIAQLASDRKLTNIRMLGPQPRSVVPSLIRESDACLVLLKKSAVFKTVIPTKMLEFMACGRPVILGVEGQAEQILRDADAGILIPPEDASALQDAILRLRADPALGARLGANGRRFVEQHFSRDATARSYVALLTTLVENEK